MPTPEFIARLRAHIGHDLLWLSTAAGVVLDDDRVLLGRRADTGKWAEARRLALTPNRLRRR